MLNLGPKADLFKDGTGRYKFEELFKKFGQDYGIPPKCMEFQLLERDVDNPNRLSIDLEYISKFIEDKGIQIVSFHYLDESFPSEISWMNKTLKEIGEERIRKDQKISCISEARERLHRTVEIIGSKGISPSPILVTHKPGVQLEKKFFETKSYFELTTLRRTYLAGLLEEHKEILEYCGNKIIFGLENSPNVIWGNNEGAICEQAFEHFLERLRLGGVYVLDIAHAAMAAHHKHQSILTGKSMKSVELEKNPSLNSLEDHIKTAGRHIKLMHLSDAAGCRLEDEGLPIGVEGSIINWKSTIKSIEENLTNPCAILEIKGGHIDYNTTMGKSLKFLLEEGLI